ncbi:T9SS sorting signal type C domain-containing protein [Flavobacterium enshiense]|uniref:T9SS sorting signal type C domain-containing protein n=1 Tax=Flavobacterium enshiense TaxID=1341165 RepID=UPI00345CF880
MRKKLSMLFVLLFSAFIYAQEGSNDNSFNPSDIGFGNGDATKSWYDDDKILSTTVQPDGKIIIGGSFIQYNGVPIKGIVRLNADGTLDTSFGTNTIIKLIVDGNEYVGPIIQSSAIQPDGKIVIGGTFTEINGTAVRGIARLNSNGTLDTSFNTGTGLIDAYISSGSLASVRSIAIQNDGKIVVGGSFTSYNGVNKRGVLRLNTDGSLDSGFAITGTGAAYNTVYKVVIQPDGKIILGGDFTTYDGYTAYGICRLNTNGTKDSSFTLSSLLTNCKIRTVSLQSDGKIIIGGSNIIYDGLRTTLVRLNSSGTVDTSFAVYTIGVMDPMVINTSLVQVDGKILIGGNFETYNGTTVNRITRLNSNGSLDTSFSSGTGVDKKIDSGTDADTDVFAMALLSNGQIIIAGEFESVNQTDRKNIARINSNRSIDMTFNTGSGSNQNIRTTAIQADQKVIIGGEFGLYNGVVTNRVARVNTDGTLDTSFNVGGSGFQTTYAIFKAAIYASAIQPDGKILLGGFFGKYNGTLINNLVRLNSDGTLDTSFNTGTGANGIVQSILVQPDGKIIIGGGFTTYNGTSINRIARLNSNGTLDTSFTPGSGAESEVRALALQSDGKILIGGLFNSYNGSSRKGIVRLNANGTLDTSFSALTYQSFFSIEVIKVQSNGKILIGGSFEQLNNITEANGFVRLNANGTVDTALSFGYADPTIYNIALQPDGKIILGGYFALSSTDKHLIRLNANGTVDTGFNTGTAANSVVYTSALLPDGKLIIAGAFTNYNGTGRNRIARINATTLSVNENVVDNNNIIAYKKGSALHIVTEGKTMQSVKLFDITGKLVYENEKVNASETTIENLSVNDRILIVAITDENNSVASKKIVF